MILDPDIWHVRKAAFMHESFSLQLIIFKVIINLICCFQLNQKPIRLGK